ncbi:MAG: C25 family cysteine peptidase [Muribaculaceae bacterium]|nr:C25 family cysteine peptidase [Muribaculaceae bacterium]
MRAPFKILLLFVFIQMWQFAGAYTALDVRTGDIVECSEIPQPVRTIEKLANGVKVTYTIDKVQLTPDPLVDGAYTPSLPGFGQTATEGEPWLPLKLERMMVADSTSCYVEILDSAYIDVKLKVSPARGVHTLDNYVEYTSSTLPPINTFGQFYPTQVIEHQYYSVYRKDVVKSLVFAPMQYNADSGTLRVFSALSFIVGSEADSKTWKAASSNSYRMSLSDYFHTLDSINAEPIPDKHASKPDNRSYLIITTEELSYWAREFYYWKHRMGYNMRLEVRESWTKETIKQCVQDFYDSDPNACYLLLFGDHAMLPAMQTKLATSYTAQPFTDMLYACMDGEGDVTPDLFYGRIPASNADEARAAVSKIISYEKGETNGEANNLVSVAQFQDNENDGYENNYFSRTSETICSLLEGNVFRKIKRLYSAPNGCTPIGWDKATVDFPFPDFLKDRSQWNATTSSVIEAFNAGANIVLHNGHGYTNGDGWGEPRFVTDDLSKLSNTAFPIVFSYSCGVGRFTEKNNFAKNLLCMDNIGCSAIFAGSETTYTLYNDVLCLAMMKSIWPEYNFRFHNKMTHFSDDGFVNSNFFLGEISALGKIKFGEVFPNQLFTRLYHEQAYNLLGDPSMAITWGATSPDVEIKYNEGRVNVFCRDGNVYISFWDTLTGRTERYYGFAASFEAIAPHDVFVRVQARGAAPIQCIAADGYPVTGRQPKILNAGFIDNETLYVRLDRDDVDGLMVSVSESVNLSQVQSCVYEVEEDVVSHRVYNSGNNLFFITLKSGDDIIERKTIYRK